MPLYQNIIASPGFSANGIVVTGEQPRITGDFSNATVANRVIVQTNTANSVTRFSLAPNGTATQSAFDSYNSSDVNNSSLGVFTCLSNEVRFNSTTTGTGTFLPMTFFTSNVERLRIDASGNVGIGTSPDSVAGYTFLTVKNNTNGGIIQVKDPSVDMRMQTSNSSAGFFGTYSNHPLLFIANASEKMRIDTAGHLYPAASGTQDLGASTLRWRNIYTSDLNLSNGIGDYTIVEGEDDLFLYNNKSGKVFKFALIEVDPSVAPPKKGIINGY